VQTSPHQYAVFPAEEAMRKVRRTLELPLFSAKNKEIMNGSNQSNKEWSDEDAVTLELTQKSPTTQHWFYGRCWPLVGKQTESVAIASVKKESNSRDLF
jgi:hypothetical protein